MSLLRAYFRPLFRCGANGALARQGWHAGPQAAADPGLVRLGTVPQTGAAVPRADRHSIIHCACFSAPADR